MKNFKLICWILWAWVICVFVGYIIQFQGFVDPVLNVLGVS
ncbi:MAG: hypothetical protein VX923_00870 [Pseudomonadota bacterium]|nr:hypothetical protein [Pseudomonadota bacterium]